MIPIKENERLEHYLISTNTSEEEMKVKYLSHSFFQRVKNKLLEYAVITNNQFR